MCLIYLIFFLLFPIAEIYLLIEIGKHIGFLDTMLLLLASGAAGVYYAKRQGFEVLSRLRRDPGGLADAQNGLDALLTMFGAFLLIFPGVISDIVGITFLVPATRRFWRGFTVSLIRRKILRGSIVRYR